MKELNLRKWHRNIGVVFVVLIILQAGSGLVLSLGEIQIPHSHADSPQAAGAGHDNGGGGLWADLAAFIHHGGGAPGAVYRILLGAGLLALAVSGGMIYMKVRGRTRTRRA